MTFELVGTIFTEIDKDCKYCRAQPENIQHLFWDCEIVKTFIQDVNNAIMSDYPLYFSHWNKRNFIFSDQGSNIQLPHNIFALYLKFYIWKTRCNEELLTLRGFINFFNYEVNIIKLAFCKNKIIDRLLTITEID